MTNFQTIFYSILFLGILLNYLFGVKYIQSLRKGNNVVKDWQIMLTSVFFGAPSLLIMYCFFSEMRLEDFNKKRRFLIFEICNLVLEIVLIVLFFVFDLL